MWKAFPCRDAIMNSPSTEHRPPPPAVVFCGELEVGQRHGDTGCHTQEDAIHHKQNTVQRVLFPTP